MSDAATLAQFIRDQAGEAPVEMGLILGSGLGHLADAVEGTAIPYADLDGFPTPGVSGHNPKLVVGDLLGTRVAIFGARAHYYEHGDAGAMRLPLEVLKALGANRLLLTNAAGSVRADTPPGELMILSDHINFAGANPLVGEATDARFVPLGDAYNAEMRAALHDAAVAENIRLNEGTYAWFSGPSFETPAEIRAIRTLGGDAVGMSTVPEVILARFFGLEVAAISAITNMAEGMSDEKLSHAHTKKMAVAGAEKLERLIRRYLSDNG
ncbi:purine-nucleoside phosphorylase [Maritimibacter sp. UBA3975]|uniref:purine-nucleoside phosphorylase n=1 Tax=Maritimibacter sp. UBA3975 TaxID=1946833 RepID=UPI000C0A3476|nr:purine-nucleoside phosphorylase [Maritimibacter sp. UBA3975]MAM60423.1 purine-nucleoside phosphorylase [Maritimibacter sp.]|tara:strand:- start:27638 stop:28441 length:804 start_codon:yes stop_codon:yes gene_type:complete